LPRDPARQEIAVMIIASTLVRLLTVVADAATPLRSWLNRRAAMRHLAEADDHMLKDLGLSRGEIESVVRGGGPQACDPTR
jgi:uncharacterized protein YjiS (DUF1127 family)